MSRVAIVTGGTRGLGREISLCLKAVGMQVVAVYHGNVEAAEQFQRATSIATEHWDVADFEACRAGVARVEQAAGPVDVLVNNAGITSDAPLHKMSLADWSRVIDTNLGSMFNMCRHTVPGMRERGFGRIVNISSINGQRGQFGQANYAASKAGVLGFTKALALENARKNVTVNAVAPGYCDTEMVAKVAPATLQAIVDGIPAARLGTPLDVARVVAFLADEASAYITGATFSVNGGLLMS